MLRFFVFPIDQGSDANLLAIQKGLTSHCNRVVKTCNAAVVKGVRLSGEVLEMSLRRLGDGGRIPQMGMRATICLSVIVVLATIPLLAQNIPPCGQTRAVVDPV